MHLWEGFPTKEESMSAQRIQFQHGLSMIQFLQCYGTETDCVQALFKARWPKGFVCPSCGGKECSPISVRRLYQCRSCHFQTSLTAGTIFHQTHLPLQKWFLAMHFLTQGKHSISALELKRQIHVSYETAWNMKHKLLQVMLERENGRVLSGRVEVDDAYMGGERHGGKRGRGAPGKAPFLAAIQTSQSEDPATRRVVYLKVQAVKNFKAATIKAWAQGTLSEKATVVTDGMPGFACLGEMVKEHEMKVMPGTWRSAAHPAFKWVNTVLGNLKGNIIGVCRWVGHKHLPRYLAEFQWRFNRRFDLKVIFARLLRAAALTPPMPHNMLVLAEQSR
jgi:transposase-like protein